MGGLLRTPCMQRLELPRLQVAGLAVCAIVLCVAGEGFGSWEFRIQDATAACRICSLGWSRAWKFTA